MDIELVKQEKHKLQNKIHALLSEFEEKTKMNIVNINVTRCYGVMISEISRIEIEVKL